MDTNTQTNNSRQFFKKVYEFHSKYEALLDKLSDDKEHEYGCDNKIFLPILEKELNVKARIIFPKDFDTLRIPFIHTSNESDELFTIFDKEDLDNFKENFNDFDLGEGVIIIEEF